MNDDRKKNDNLAYFINSSLQRIESRSIEPSQIEISIKTSQKTSPTLSTLSKKIATIGKAGLLLL